MVEVKWFSPGNTQSTIGIVYKKDENGERCYIGCGDGYSEDQDIESILNWGAKFPVEDGKKLIGIKEPVVPVEPELSHREYLTGIADKCFGSISYHLDHKSPLRIEAREQGVMGIKPDGTTEFNPKDEFSLGAIGADILVFKDVDTLVPCAYGQEPAFLKHLLNHLINYPLRTSFPNTLMGYLPMNF